MTELPHACQVMLYAITEQNMHIRYVPRYREFVLDYVSGGSVQVLNFCPFCGARLPAPLSQAWFDRLAAMGLEPFDDPIPREYESDRWWREASL